MTQGHAVLEAERTQHTWETQYTAVAIEALSTRAQGMMMRWVALDALGCKRDARSLPRQHQSTLYCGDKNGIRRNNVG